MGTDVTIESGVLVPLKDVLKAIKLSESDAARAIGRFRREVGGGFLSEFEEPPETTDRVVFFKWLLKSLKKEIRDGEYPVSSFSDVAEWLDAGLPRVTLFDASSGERRDLADVDDVAEFTEDLAPAIRGAFQGYVDARGEWAVEPRFEVAGFFHEGVARALLKGRWGFIDREGRWAIEPQFDDATDFSERLAGVKTEGTWRIVDRQGKPVGPSRYEQLGRFIEGRALAKHNDRWGFVNYQGEWAIPPAFQGLRAFREGLAVAQDEWRWGAIDEKGDWAIPPKFQSLQDFAEGRSIADSSKLVDRSGEFVAHIEMDDGDDSDDESDAAVAFCDGLARDKAEYSSIGFLDPSGRWAIEPKFQGLETGFGEGVAYVSWQDGSGFVDHQGRVLLEYADDSVFGNVLFPFSEGLAVAETLPDRLHGFLDVRGVFAIPRPFKRALPFCRGLAPVQADSGSWGMIDKSGTWVIEPRFEEFAEGVSDPWGAKHENRWGFCDRRGDWQVEPSYDGVGAFVDGLAPARIGELWGFVDLRGDWVVPPRFEEVHSFSDGLAKARQKGRWGYVDRTGRWAIEATFQEATSFCEGVAAAFPTSGEKGNEREWGLIDREGRKTRRLPPCEPMCDTPFGDFREGLVPACYPVSWGFVSASGDWLIYPSFEAVRDFQEGVAAAKRERLWGFIDKSGSVVVAFAYQDVRDFHEGVAAAKSDNRWGLIDRLGAWVVAPEYAKCSYLGDGCWKLVKVSPFLEGLPPIDDVIGVNDISFSDTWELEGGTPYAVFSADACVETRPTPLGQALASRFQLDQPKVTHWANATW